MHRNPLDLAFILGLVLALSVGEAHADSGSVGPSGRRHLVEVGVYGGALFLPKAHELYDLDAGWKPLGRTAFTGGLRVAYLPWCFVGLELEGGIAPTRLGGDWDLSAQVYSVRAHAIGQWPGRFAPFLLAGYGLLAVASDDEALGTDLDGAFHAGAGLKVFITRWLLARVDGRALVSGKVGRGGNEVFFEAGAGLSYVFGAEPVDRETDSDGDGLLDSKDRCPDVASKLGDGCPGDSDGDGLRDDKDRCPSVAAARRDGCPPDTDGDGFLDTQDRCPQVPGEPPDGCPADSDGDGVLDDKDLCPQMPARTGDGCPPDSDGDSVWDSKDRCPYQPETRNGFKDEDGCPDQAPGATPEPAPSTTPPLDLPVVYFMPRKADLIRRQRLALDRVAQALKTRATLSLVIRGHADDLPTESANQALSLRRATAVRLYLVQQSGIDPGQLEVQALGSSEKKYRGTQASRRAANRRVEIRFAESSSERRP